MFDLNTFNACLLADNPTYERVLRSDLHDVVSLVTSGGYSVDRLAQEMRKVKKEKWRKYSRTYAYLLAEHQGLAAALRGKLVRFRTKSLTRGASGAIVHALQWESDTGDLTDLAHLRVREHVSWNAPNPNTRPFVIPEYQRGGDHMGVGNAAYTPGHIGRGDDTHSALGPFTPQIFQLQPNATLEYVMNQVYEQSTDDGATWTAIPNSRYTITRKVTHTGQRIRLEIIKAGPDRLSNTHEF
ncbi:MAG: hypothetical protein AB7N76_27745 [Planctomycetota bacterium]